MNSDQFKGQWKEIKGKAKLQWGKLTEDDLLQIDGSKDQLVGRIQKRYGKTKKEAEKEVDECFL